MFWHNNKKRIYLSIASKICVIALIFSLFVSSSVALAQTDPQLEGYLSGAEPGEFDASLEVKNIAVDLLGCSAGQLLSNLIQAGFNSLFGSLTGQLKNQAMRLVPIDTQYTELEKDTKLQTSAGTMQAVFGIPFGSSWDAMAWCIVNSIITDVANKTIEWANSGFSGKPAFLENPDRFFQGLADREAAGFLTELAYGATGVNLCEPFRVEIALALSQSYGDSYSNINRGGAVGTGGALGAYGKRAACSIDDIYQNLQNFSSNNVSVGARNTGYWTAFNATTKRQNNAWGSYMFASDYLNARVQAQQNTARFELGLNRGWLNFKKCEDPEDPNSCNTYTPGTLIQSSLEKSLGIPKDRLVSVQKFDQVITAIVNNLIKVALDKVLESTQE